MTFHEVFRRACWRRPDQVFLFCDDDSITYSEANRQTDSVAASLCELELRPGDRVDVVMENSIDAILTCIASWKVGLLPVMIEPRSEADDLSYYANFAGSAAVVYDDDLEDRIIQATDVKMRVPRSRLNQFKIRSVSSFRGVNDDMLGANVSFTTGTTGRPKGVILPHGAVTLASACIAERMALNSADVILHPGPLASSFHLVAMLLPGMHRCATMGMMGTWDPAAAWRLISERGVSVFTAYPMILGDLVDYARRQALRSPTLRLAMSGGSTTPLEIKRRYQRHLGIPLIESYGQSELGGFIALGDPRHDPAEHPMAPGRALPDKTVAIFDDQDAELPIGECGEIVLRGGFMLGYWNAPQQTATALRGGWLHSGDVGRIDPDGFIELLCRKGDQLEHDGEWVFPRVLEEALYTHPAVEHAAAINFAGGRGIKAYVSLLADAQERPTQAQLVDFCARQAPAYLQPRDIQILERMPRTGSGKLNKPALRGMGTITV
jgi:acyl-CoA synthetase (AMP-forming)/AMP-acid ligase II